MDAKPIFMLAILALCAMVFSANDSPANASNASASGEIPYWGQNAPEENASSVELLFPLNGATAYTDDLSFYFIYHKGLKGRNISTCYLYLSMRTTPEALMLPDGQVGMINLTNTKVKDGNYSWGVRCDDTYSESRPIEVINAIDAPQAPPLPPPIPQKNETISVQIGEQKGPDILLGIIAALAVIGIIFGAWHFLRGKKENEGEK